MPRPLTVAAAALLLLARADAAGAAATRRGTAPGGLQPIRGTWLDLSALDPRGRHATLPGTGSAEAAWDVKLEEFSKLGMEYLIVSYVAGGGKALYPSKALPAGYDPKLGSPVSAVLRAADRRGLKVFLGCGAVQGQDDDIRDPRVLERLRTILRETAAEYGSRPSFYGWYLPSEASIAPRLPEHYVRYVEVLAAEMRRLTPRARILISPYGVSSGGATADDYAAQLARLPVDIVAYQDEVGCVRAPFPLLASAAGFARLRAAHAKAPRVALWANVESFTWDGPPNRRDVPLVPAAFPRILAQLAAVSPHVETVVCFTVQGMMDLPGSPVPLGQPVWSSRLARLYLDYLAGKPASVLLAASMTGALTHDAVGRPAALAEPPSPKYARGGLTDGVLGTESAMDPAWLGFEGRSLDAVVDMGRSVPVRRLAARFLQSAPASIRLPRRVVFSVSDDGRAFRRAAEVRPETWPNDRLDLWADMAVSEGLRLRARYVRVQAENAGGWLFVDEVLVNPRPEAAPRR